MEQNQGCMGMLLYNLTKLQLLISSWNLWPLWTQQLSRSNKVLCAKFFFNCFFFVDTCSIYCLYSNQKVLSLSHKIPVSLGCLPFRMVSLCMHCILVEHSHFITRYNFGKEILVSSPQVFFKNFFFLNLHPKLLKWMLWDNRNFYFSTN